MRILLGCLIILSSSRSVYALDEDRAVKQKVTVDAYTDLQEDNSTEIKLGYSYEKEADDYIVRHKLEARFTSEDTELRYGLEIEF